MYYYTSLWEKSKFTLYLGYLIWHFIKSDCTFLSSSYTKEVIQLVFLQRNSIHKHFKVLHECSITEHGNMSFAHVQKYSFFVDYSSIWRIIHSLFFFFFQACETKWRIQLIMLTKCVTFCGFMWKQHQFVVVHDELSKQTLVFSINITFPTIWVWLCMYVCWIKELQIL